MSKLFAIATAAVVIGLAVSVVAPSEAQADQRFITITAIEPKGGATIDKEPYPSAALPAGGGYVRKAPDQTGRWEVSAYMFMPSQIIVEEGDEVTLQFVGINGDTHATTIAGYGKSFVLKRGTTTTVSFKADKSGVFPIMCRNHSPSMSGELIVLAKK